MKTCKACRNDFEPMRSTQVVCNSYVCAQAYAQAKRELKERKILKLERAQTRKAKQDLKTLKEWRNDLQKVFNRWIVVRDRGLPCISCQEHRPPYQAGHYLTVGARPELRFDPENVNAQCIHCNMHKHGNVALHRMRIVAKSGAAVVDRLEGPNPPLKYGIAEIRELIATYRAKTRALLAEHKEAA